MLMKSSRILRILNARKEISCADPATLLCGAYVNMWKQVCCGQLALSSKERMLDQAHDVLKRHHVPLPAQPRGPSGSAVFS